MLLQSKPPVLVTGATGNVGRTVVRTLLDAGVPVRALAAAPDAVPSRLGFSSPLLSVVAFDFERPETYAAAFDGGAAMFLLRPPAIGDASVLSRAVDAAHEQGVSHVAFLSIQGAEKNPLVPHHAIERHLKAIASKDRSFSYVLLRAAFFMQNLSGTHAADIREHDEILVPAGDGRTAFVDARDVGAAAAHVLLDRADAPSARRAYDLTGRDALSYDEVAAILSQVCGRTIRYRHPSLLRFYRAMRGRGHPRGFIMVMMALYSTARMGLAAQLSNDLEELLGRPPISLQQFARDMATAFMPHAPEPADHTGT